MTTTDNINIWKIVHSIDNNEYINSIDVDQNKKTHLLDLSKDTYCLLEKFVYDTAQFHFKRLNIDVTTNNYYIEFWCKNKFDTHALHVDCDEYQKNANFKYSYPLLSCVTYFNDNACPTIITNVDLEAYKYKNFETQDALFFSLPRCNKQITFNGSFYHGSSLFTENDTEDSRYIIAINLWDKKPYNVDYYNNSNINIDAPVFNKQEQIVTINEEPSENRILNITVYNKIINYQLYEDILYHKHKHSCYHFGKLIQDTLETTTNNNVVSSYTFTLEKIAEQQLKNKYSDIMLDIAEITDETTVFKYNRFLQRFHYAKIYTPDICRFIINECENFASQNNGWTTKRHHNYPTTDLPVDKIASIFGLILETMNTIVIKIKKSYGLGDDIGINVSDLFVVKYSDNAQNNLVMHRDGSFLSFNILLSDVSNFEGGGTYFDDGLTHYPEQGDILIHSSKIKHSGLAITKGTRYLLVGFLNLM
jgi:hypothetical protein